MNQTLVRIAELTRRGLSAEEIAQRLEVSAGWVSAVMGTDAFRYVQESNHEGAQDCNEEGDEGSEAS